MKVAKNAGQDAGKFSPAMQRALLLCAVLVLCALVYIFVSMQSQNSQTAIAVLITPPPHTSPTPTAYPGLRKAVVLDRLMDADLFVDARDPDATVYTISVSREVPTQNTLRLFLQSGYVCGFSLEIAAITQPKLSKSQTEIEKALQAQYEEQMALREESIRTILPILLNSLTDENYFSPSTTLVWVALAYGMQEGDEPVHESEHGLSFVSIFSKDGKLTLTADLQ